MKIQYLGHSSFLLTFEGGARVVTDPFGDVGFFMPHVQADAVSVSHGHYDHCNTAAVRAPLVLSAAGEYEVKGVKISAVERYHDEVRGKKRGTNLVFRFVGDGLSLVHLGDLGEPCCEETLRAIGRADVLFLPVGGNYTIGAREAKAYVDALAPAVVIPMHYKVKGLQIDIAGVGPFLSLFQSTEQAGKEITLTPETLGAGRIIVMERS